jgi:hypothetical protein
MKFPRLLALAALALTLQASPAAPQQKRGPRSRRPNSKSE